MERKDIRIQNAYKAIVLQFTLGIFENRKNLFVTNNFLNRLKNRSFKRILEM